MFEMLVIKWRGLLSRSAWQRFMSGRTRVTEWYLDGQEDDRAGK